LRLELKRIQQDMGATMLYVTHDQTEALTMATRVGVLEQGRLVQLGTPREIYEDPVSSYVASRLGTPRINLVPRAALAALATLAAPDHAATIGIRSEHLVLSRSNSDAAEPLARVVRVERLSDQHLVHVQVNGTDQELVSATPASTGLETGEAVNLQVRRALWFDASGQRLSA
jgi:multiple sugar transport system ATP-binding protein